MVDDRTITTVGSDDNIFAAFELPDTGERLAKAELSRAIDRLIRLRDLTQVEAARASWVSHNRTLRILCEGDYRATR